MKNKNLWITFIGVLVVCFGVLVFFGGEIYRQAPPVPAKVLDDKGQVLFTKQNIMDGQNVWQSIGGQEVGTVWGHGAYVAPDWSADWLHRENLFLREALAMQKFKKGYMTLDVLEKGSIDTMVKLEMRKNTYDAATGELKLSALRAAAFQSIAVYYSGLFMNDPALEKTRSDYAIRPNSVSTIERMNLMNFFFFWAAWVCVTERPGSDITYTHNWPPDASIGNVATSSLFIWSIVSVLFLLAGIAILVFNYARTREDDCAHPVPQKDPLLGATMTPSMKAVLKYFWVVAGLFLLQVGLGALVAHYAVEGNGFYGLDLNALLPYSISRTWHVQLAIFWIATSWLATGLYLAPAVSGVEPKWQSFGVNVLFGALLIVVLGSMTGEWLGIMQKLGFKMNFLFGTQGLEYVDLGRVWQILLFAGLLIWLFLMLRALWPALKKPSESRQLLVMFVIASVAIGAFYGAGLAWGQQTHLSIIEYWRWWVVHLWVEGFFEIFATVAAAFLFVKLGLLGVRSATSNVIFASIIYLLGGILGTFHHLYFAGTPTAVIALGATFSALEVVPLVLMGFEAWNNMRLSRSTPWVAAYKWAIYSLISVSFWNLVGAGLFGFLINPPIALFYMQGLNTTPLHGHTALFGVYGMLGIALMLFCLRGLSGNLKWKEGSLKFAFWTINGGLLLMALLSLLPVGILQTLASVDHGIWYARSAEFMQQPHLVTLRWLRLIGDTVFGIGTLALVWFVVGLKTGWSIEKGKIIE